MSRRILRFGVAIGLVGGGVMATFAMVTMWATGHGFFTIVNLFAHTFWSGAPLDGTYVLAAFELGLAIHLVISIGIGITIAAVTEAGQLDATVVFVLAVGIGAGAWIVQAIAWPAVDADAHAAFTPWVLGVAHLVFALGAAWLLTALEGRTDEAPDDARSQVPGTGDGARPGVTDRLADRMTVDGVSGTCPRVGADL